MYISICIYLYESVKLKDNGGVSEDDKASDCDGSISNMTAVDDSFWEKMEESIERKLEEKCIHFESSIKGFITEEVNKQTESSR